MLTDEQKAEIRQALVGNMHSRAAKAWADVDLDEAGDEELMAFNELLTMVRPVDQGVVCPCGRTHTYNESRRSFVANGTPKAAKQPASVEEFLATGGGTPRDREDWQMVQNMSTQRRNEVLEQLTTNMSDSEREATWNDYKDLPLPELEKMAKRFGARQTQPSVSTPNYYGAQGLPMPGSTLPSPGSMVVNEKPLESPTLEFPLRRGREAI